MVYASSLDYHKGLFKIYIKITTKLWQKEEMLCVTCFKFVLITLESILLQITGIRHVNHIAKGTYFQCLDENKL